MTRITRREWLIVVLFTLVVLLLTSIPYWLAWSREGAEWSFSGFMLGVQDGASYLAKLRLGARGLWDFYLLHTPEPHAGTPLINLPYILPGQIIRLFVPLDDPRLPYVLIGVFHLLRWLCGALFIAAVYGFVARFLRRPADRVLALVLVTLGGGLGWLLAVTGNGEWMGSLPVDLFVPEAFPFHMLYGLPHLALAGAGMLGGLTVLLGAGEQSRDSTARGVGATRRVAPTGRWWLTTLCWLITGLSVPFYLAVIYVVLAAWGLATWILQQRFPMVLLRRALLPALLTLPLFGYYALAFQGNPALAQWSAQNLLPSPHPLHYLLAFALILMPAWWGARRAWNRARLDFRQALLLAWPVIVPLLVYLPINVQRRLAALVIVPLAILAVMGLRWLIHQRPRLRFARPLLLTAMLATSAFLIFTGSLSALNPRVPIFREAAELRALQWLNQQAPVDSVVLAAFETGNVIPAYTDLRPFVGHGPESLFALAKTDQTETFFGGQMGEAERLALYQEFAIRYILYGPLERKLAEAAGLDPTTLPWAVDGDLIYEADGYQLYQLTAY
ncbi:MAG TPA: hypothetical protein PLQ56_05160 [Aggregatilineales bacterium]|nr:hypothetical protein [Aggregatilineales bacterium]